MLTKSKLALAAALILGAASATQAANDNQSDPTRGFPYGPEGQRVGGKAVNKVHHLSTRPGGPYAPKTLSSQASAKGEAMLRSGDKCWMDQHIGNNGWGDCPPEQSKRAPNATKASAQAPSRLRPAAEGGGGGGRY
jgi:hypothetical protein